MSELAQITEAQRALAEVETPAEAKALYDRLEALSQYARRYGLEHEQMNEIAEAKLRTARKGGEILRDTIEHRGGRLASATEAKLPEGLSQQHSHRWQRLAAVEADEFETFIETTKASENVELTLAGALRLGRKKSAQMSRPNLKKAARKVVEMAAREGRGYVVPVQAMEELMVAVGER